MKSTYIATSNIALVKYWGKRDASLNLPTNGSISATMDESLKTTTTVEFASKYKKDQATINGKELEGGELAKISAHLDLLRSAAKSKEKARVVSENSFPSSAGFASSAAGFAALTVAAANALDVKSDAGQLSLIARRGSGSASRSLFGGFAEWKAGEKHDGSDSYAVSIAPASHWKEFCNVIATVRKEPKKVPSRAGMNATVKTSRLFQTRVDSMPRLLEHARQCILKKDLPRLLETVMRDSNDMHATMLDTYPPLFYMNDASRAVIEQVHAFNEGLGEVAAGYTFDAGPNAHVFTIDKYAPAVQKLLAEVEGVENVQVCKLGNGPREIKQHLF